MERRERVVLENMCMIRDGSKVLVEDKIGKDIRGMKGVDSVYGDGSAQYIGKAIEAFYMR